MVVNYGTLSAQKIIISYEKPNKAMIGFVKEIDNTHIK